MSQHARRTLFTADARFAFAKAADKPRTLEGYALVWNVLSSDRGGFQVRLMPGSAQFETPTQALLHHDWSKPLGTTDNGTLRIIPDDYGVKVEIDVAKVSYGDDAIELVSGKYVKGMSFSMAEMPDGRMIRENGVEIFEATKFRVDEVTITNIPSFNQTSIGVKKSDATFSDIAKDAMRFQELCFAMLR